MKKHLAIFNGNLAQDILDGKKTIESRFSKVKLPPFGQIGTEDIVYIKPLGKGIIGQFRVKKVISYDGLTQEDLLAIKAKFGAQIAADESFWELKMDSKYGTLIFIGEVNSFITPPIKIQKRDQRGWLVLD